MTFRAPNNARAMRAFRQEPERCVTVTAVLYVCGTLLALAVGAVLFVSASIYAATKAGANEVSIVYLATVLFHVNGKPARIVTDPPVVYLNKSDCDKAKNRDTAGIRAAMSFMYDTKADCQRREVK